MGEPDRDVYEPTTDEDRQVDKPRKRKRRDQPAASRRGARHRRVEKQEPGSLDPRSRATPSPEQFEEFTREHDGAGDAS